MSMPVVPAACTDKIRKYYFEFDSIFYSHSQNHLIIVLPFYTVYVYSCQCPLQPSLTHDTKWWTQNFWSAKWSKCILCTQRQYIESLKSLHKCWFTRKEICNPALTVIQIQIHATGLQFSMSVRELGPVAGSEDTKWNQLPQAKTTEDFLLRPTQLYSFHLHSLAVKDHTRLTANTLSVTVMHSLRYIYMPPPPFLPAHGLAQCSWLLIQRRHSRIFSACLASMCTAYSNAH